ncbi:MAG: acyltransferase [Flavobacteriaceae bacterium]
MFPFEIAKKFPVFIYGPVKLSNLSGKITIKKPIKAGIIGFGQKFEVSSCSSGIEEIYIAGHLVLNGHVKFGKDYFLYVEKDAECSIGHMSTFAFKSRIICKHKISIGDWVQSGSETHFIDTNFHDIINTNTGEVYTKCDPININNYNYIGSRVLIRMGTITSNYTLVASYSLCNKDYSTYGENTLIGGVPAKLLKTNISRDWEGERSRLEKVLTVEL